MVNTEISFIIFFVAEDGEDLYSEQKQYLTHCSSDQFSSVQSLSHVWLFAAPWTAAHQASLSITNSWSLLKLMPIELVMPSNHLILCRPLPLLPSIFPSIRVFSNESALRNRWPKYWSFSFNISPSSEYSGLISFRVDWLDLFAVQGTLKSLLLCCWKRVFAMTSGFSWQISIRLCPASFCTPRPNLPVTPGVSWLPTFAFQSPKMKRISFLDASSKRSYRSS